MIDKVRGTHGIWSRPPLIGMVHLLPLPGSPGWAGDVGAVLDRALSDARALERAGFDGVLVENFGDVPFHPDRVPRSTVASMSHVVAAITSDLSLPVGVNVLRNDADAALAIAAACGGAFIRVNVHTGVMYTDQGIVQGRAADTLRTRAALGADVAILADVHVKHATPPPGSTLAEVARDCWERGLADGLIVTGGGTGQSHDPASVRAVKEAAPEAPVFVGSGVTQRSVASVLGVADGVIVGTQVTTAGRAGSGIDATRALAMVRATGR